MKSSVSERSDGSGLLLPNGFNTKNIGKQIPRVENRPEGIFPFNSGEEISELASAYGLVLDPWQDHVLTGAMNEHEDGTWVTPRVGLSVPRQNGKNAILEARELGGLLLLGEELIIHSAHEVKTALEAFIRIRSYFENFDDLRKKTRRIVSARGAEEIVLLNGQRLRFMARSKGAGRGFSADCIIMDEAQHLSDTTFRAILPTLSARPNPQIWFTGTPPGPEQDGEVFGRTRTAGMEGSKRLYWAEWSADPKRNPDDLEGWKEGNPAYGIRITKDTIQDEREGLDELGFCMERLGQWEAAEAQAVIPATVWEPLGVLDPVPEREVRSVAFGVDMDPERTTASVSAAFPMTLEDGSVVAHLEVIQKREGTAWLIPYLAGLVRRRDPRALVIDASGPAASLIEPLRKKGVLVTSASTQHLKQACGQIYDGAYSGTLRHSMQAQLNSALSIARKRDLGDAWTWHRRDSGDDITPLVSATLALWGLNADNVATPKVQRKKTVSKTYYSFS